MKNLIQFFRFLAMAACLTSATCYGLPDAENVTPPTPPPALPMPPLPMPQKNSAGTGIEAIDTVLNAFPKTTLKVKSAATPSRETEKQDHMITIAIPGKESKQLDLSHIISLISKQGKSLDQTHQDAIDNLAHQYFDSDISQLQTARELSTNQASDSQYAQKIAAYETAKQEFVQKAHVYSKKQLTLKAESGAGKPKTAVKKEIAPDNTKHPLYLAVDNATKIYDELDSIGKIDIKSIIQAHTKNEIIDAAGLQRDISEKIIQPLKTKKANIAAALSILEQSETKMAATPVVPESIDPKITREHMQRFLTTTEGIVSDTNAKMSTISITFDVELLPNRNELFLLNSDHVTQQDRNDAAQKYAQRIAESFTSGISTQITPNIKALTDNIKILKKVKFYIPKLVEPKSTGKIVAANQRTMAQEIPTGQLHEPAPRQTLADLESRHEAVNKAGLKSHTTTPQEVKMHDNEKPLVTALPVPTIEVPIPTQPEDFDTFWAGLSKNQPPEASAATGINQEEFDAFLADITKKTSKPAEAEIAESVRQKFNKVRDHLEATEEALRLKKQAILNRPSTTKRQTLEQEKTELLNQVTIARKEYNVHKKAIEDTKTEYLPANLGGASLSTHSRARKPASREK